MKVYLTNKARVNAIKEISRQISALGGVKSGELSYYDYRAIVKSLSLLQDVLGADMSNEGE